MVRWTKFLILCSTEERKWHGFGTNWRWVNGSFFACSISRDFTSEFMGGSVCCLIDLFSHDGQIKSKFDWKQVQLCFTVMTEAKREGWYVQETLQICLFFEASKPETLMSLSCVWYIREKSEFKACWLNN